MSTESKVFLITGSSRGLGREIARAALLDGNRVVATARRPEQVQDLVDTFGDAVRTVPLDVTDPIAATSAVRTAVDEFGRLDVLVNNAGYADLVSIEDVTLESFRAQVETNLFGVVTMTKAALPVLRVQGSGHIVQISSVGGRVASVGLGAYQAAKWAVGGFSEVLAKEVAQLGIAVTILEPGGMRTDWAGSSMSIPPISQPYEATVGARARMIREGKSALASDPAKVAQVVLHVVAMPDPPLRLLVGTDAFTYATKAAEDRLVTDRTLRELSVSTDHDESTAADLDPLGG
ncbi:MAG: SDR family NAD(P)-dependent oxidoreductase [Pseudonocardia sp.]|uniref:SDR family NAD(P)-dependent oxidoreductase n=1 Tax=unclassified Pseudonocardia TaxID=2619320 RepID=UPI00086F5AD1|nr:MULTISPECIES: SDR family NAD(P)-dependent oxidoreductase [unclassified Pseudonocardia]MBN9108324.1 SDR family NAD(P)-dependent oxidoreductase [Pseudonocardia sp.]ODU30309.1 MAG: short-chain dehydrogenase/reductase [Pseudonocardia sp. SCN 72-51]ODV08705.1 MAG: short-chain dehydrogenase/reductase [Pseudonocardia sp. SCN 73-27]